MGASELLQRDSFYMISNTRSMKLICDCRRTQRAARNPAPWKTGGVNDFKAERGVFTCSGHELELHITSCSAELGFTVGLLRY